MIVGFERNHHSLIKKSIFLCMALLGSLCLFLTGCASSEVSRDAASNVDSGVQNTKSRFGGVADSDLADAYQNSSQTTKGILLGGAAGAITGSLTSSVGFIPGTIVGAILGASYGSYIDANTTLQDKLQNRGANIIILGDQVLIVVPSARIFDPWTSTVKPSAYSTVDLLAQYLNQFTKILVKVAVYSNDSGSKEADLSLTKQQAENLAKILLATGIDARFLYSIGCGSSHFVMRNSSGWDNDNNRIEITLERLYV